MTVKEKFDAIKANNMRVARHKEKFDAIVAKQSTTAKSKKESILVAQKHGQLAFPIGRTIKNMRWATKKELKREGWEDGNHPLTVFVLDDGSIIYPSCDEEGNGAGAMFGVMADGESVYAMPDTPATHSK